MDRGPDAPGTIDFLIKLKEQVPCFFLRGNHDSMFLNHFGLGGNNGRWFSHPQNGGNLTLLQYSDNIPEEHKQFILDTKIFLETDNFFFSHAGFNIWSSRPYDNQTEEDYTWTREDFLGWSHKEKLDKVIIHGHTIESYLPSWDEELMKVNLDSGAFRSGNLSSITIIPTDTSKCYMSVSNVKKKHFENAGFKA